ncbi:MAG: class I SAM-dependent methyltransferase [Proteobacteria bacterium]|nr:class I SAM-dependent methyltransferase [Pseudomonadota bacterium]
MASPLNDPKLEALLDRLHAQSDAQVEETDMYYERREQEGSLNDDNFSDDDMHRFLSDKLVALDRDKAEFCYQLCRSLRATRIVEAGTSFGISTLYLAAAIRDNQVENGVVIGTEHEPSKVKIALENFREAGLSDFIDLREGDLRQTLEDVGGPVDFMLVDIWDVALPALERVSSSLRPGAIVVCDNTTVAREEYRDYFEFVHDPRNRFRTLTVPFQGGFELTVRI